MSQEKTNRRQAKERRGFFHSICRGKARFIAGVVAAAAVLVFAGSASARSVYVANSGSGTVSVIDSNTNR